MSDADAPGYWMNETSGVLKSALKAYLFTSAELTDEQIGALRAYFRQLVNAPGFVGKDVESLRERIDGLTSTKAISAWLDAAVSAGIDPL